MSEHKTAERLVHVHDVTVFMSEQSVNLCKDHHLLIWRSGFLRRKISMVWAARIYSKGSGGVARNSTSLKRGSWVSALSDEYAWMIASSKSSSPPSLR